MSDKKVILPESTDELIEKWSPVIEGTGKWEKVIDGMPKVPVNQHKILATQLEILEQTELQEASSSSAIGNYTPILIPMVRRVMPALIGNEIFGVQPMTGPTGMIFSLKSLYQGDGADAVDAEYEILVVADSSGFVADADISGDVAGVGKVVHSEDNAILVKLVSGTFATSANVDDTDPYSSSVTTITRVFADGEALANVIFKSFSGSMTTADGEFLGTDTKEMGFEIGTNSVTAKTRKLKARWTMELEDDLRAVHGLNAEQLLSGVAGDEIVREMNREFIDQIKAYAALTSDNGLAAASWTYDNTENFDQGRYENEKYLSLINIISRQRRKLAVANRRGQATFMIVTSGVLTALEATGRFKSNGDPLSNAFVGTFDGMKVFVDLFPTTAEEAVYLGYKGGSEIDAGLYYCPYIPLRVNKGYGEEDNIPRLFFSTRYGLTENPFGAKNYYQKITVNSLPN